MTKNNENQMKNEQTTPLNTEKSKTLGSAKKLAISGVMVALAYVISILQFPIFPSASFLQLDFSNVIILLAGYVLGPLYGVFITFAKELLCLTKTSTGGVGEAANFLLTTSFILLPTLVYKYKKGFKTVILFLSIATIIETAMALLVNRFINFPLYMGKGAASAFASLYPFIIYFNLIKCVVISIITILLYKRIAKLIRKI